MYTRYNTGTKELHRDISHEGPIQEWDSLVQPTTNLHIVPDVEANLKLTSSAEELLKL